MKTQNTCQCRVDLESKTTRSVRDACREGDRKTENNSAGENLTGHAACSCGGCAHAPRAAPRAMPRCTMYGDWCAGARPCSLRCGARGAATRGRGVAAPRASPALYTHASRAPSRTHTRDTVYAARLSKVTKPPCLILKIARAETHTSKARRLPRRGGRLRSCLTGARFLLWPRRRG